MSAIWRKFSMKEEGEKREGCLEGQIASVVRTY